MHCGFHKCKCKYMNYFRRCTRTYTNNMVNCHTMYYTVNQWNTPDVPLHSTRFIMNECMRQYRKQVLWCVQHSSPAPAFSYLTHHHHTYDMYVLFVVYSKWNLPSAWNVRWANAHLNHVENVNERRYIRKRCTHLHSTFIPKNASFGMVCLLVNILDIWVGQEEYYYDFALECQPECHQQKWKENQKNGYSNCAHCSITH